ncbi:DinB family protein [Bacillus mangrovi]|uniref:DinB family protein n=1 Tax=Metabacillus mangrovi TaxID=1491830 RepID=A0A7X2S1Z9_9BACI|nr:DinB family protein [Metabacillus mangrovi]MTH52254.1 DinB family protein [Metabacillus mangrovi]
MENSRKETLLTLRNYSWKKNGWNASLSQALENVTAADAAWKPPGGGNTIWETVNHLNYFNARTLEKLLGKTPDHTVATNEETFGAAGSVNDEEKWKSAVSKTEQLMTSLIETIEKLSEENVAEGEWDIRLPEIMMHDAYHTGQIVLIRKMQGSWPAQRDFE